MSSKTLPPSCVRPRRELLNSLLWDGRKADSPIHSPWQILMQGRKVLFKRVLKKTAGLETTSLQPAFLYLRTTCPGGESPSRDADAARAGTGVQLRHASPTCFASIGYVPQSPCVLPRQLLRWDTCVCVHALPTGPTGPWGGRSSQGRLKDAMCTHVPHP